jgi:predicted transcriptional regulator YdeE
VDIVELGPMTVVGLEVRASFRGLWREVPRAWEALFARAEEIAHRSGSTFVDVSVGVEDGIHRQVVGAQVASAGVVPDGMTSLEIPARRYLYHRHRGPLTGIASSFANMQLWAQAKGMSTGHFKLDVGYTRGFTEKTHDLYLALEG